MVRSLLIFLFMTFCSHLLLAAPANFVYQGQIIKPDGLALESASVSFTIEILSPLPSECVLYKETHSLNMTNSNGLFSIEVGSGTQSGANYEDVTSLTVALSNSTGSVTPTTCVAGPNYNPGFTDGRQIRVTFDDGSGPTTISQNHQVVSVPYADSASSIDGIASSDLLTINTGGGYVLDQTNLEWIFETGARYTELQNLINGTSTQYLSGAPAADLDVNSNKIINVDPPTAGTDAANKNYVDQNIGGQATDAATLSALAPGDAGEVLTWSGTQWTSGAPAGDSTKLPLAGGTMTGALNMGGQDITNSNDVAVGNDLTVGNNAVVTGSVSANGLSTSGALAIYNGANFMGLQSPAGAADLIWTLPATDGANGQVLTTDGAGQLVWANDSAPVTTVFGRAGAVAAQASDYDADQVDNTPAGNIASTDVQAAINELDTEKLIKAGDAMTGALTMNAENEIRFSDNDDSHYVGFKAPAAVTAGASFVWELPADDGTVGQVLETDGAGVLSWRTISAAGETNTASNQGTAGVGVFDNKNGVDFEMRNINAGSTKVTVTLDGANKEIDLDVAEANFDQTAIPNTPAGNIAATNVQAAINELDTEKLSAVVGAPLTDTNIWVGDGSNQAAAVAMSGDATMANNGAVTIANNAITSAKINDGEIVDADVSATADITRTKLAAGTAHRVLVNDASGEVAEAAAITASRALESDANGIPVASSVTSTELGYVSGVTSAIQTQLDAKVDLAGDTMTGALNLDNNQELQLSEADGNGANYVALKTPAALAADYTLTLPVDDGTAGQVLETDGAGVLSWRTLSAVGESNTASNQGTAGVGVFDNKNGVDLELRNINAGSTKVTVTLDGANKEIDLDVAEANFDQTAIPNTPAGNIAATNVQAAINELDTEKLSTVVGSSLTDTNIWVGDGSNQAAAVAMSGDATMANTGAVTIANNAITSAKINDGEIVDADVSAAADITRTKLAAGTAHRILVNDASGEVAEAAAITASRALASDANGIPVASSVTSTELGYVSGVTSAIQTQLDAKVDLAGDTMTGALNLDNNQELQLSEADGNGTDLVALKTPAALAASYTLTLPVDDGTNGQVLETDGAGVLSWRTLSAVGESNTASNQGTAGVGVFDNKNGVDFEMRNINAGSTKVTVTLDGANKEIDLDVAEANFDQTAIPNTPAGNIAATNVQAAINELDTEKLSTVVGSSLTDTNIWVGDGSNQAAAVAMSGDATMANTGAVTIANNAITSAKINDGEIVDADVSAAADITRTKLAAGTAHRILVNDASGEVAEAAAITASRALASDANGIPVASSVTSTELGYVSGVTSAIQTQLDAKVDLAGDTMTGALNLDNNQELQLSEADGNGANYVALKTPAALAADYTLTLPVDDGTAGQVLSTDGAGVLSWVANGVGDITGGSSLGSGVDVYRNENAGVLEFASINSGSTKVTITNDVINDEVDIDVDESNFDQTAIPNTAAGNIVATNIQAAINELDTEKVALAGGTMTGALNLDNNQELQLSEGDGNGTDYVAIKTPAALAAGYTLTLPVDDGTNGQVLQTDGSGALSWVANGSGSGDFMADGSVAMTGNLVIGANYINGDSDSQGLRVDTAGRASVDVQAAGIERALALENNAAPATDTGVAVNFNTNSSSSMGQVAVAYEGANDDNSYMAFSTRASDTLGEAARIDSSGNMGIGTNSPSGRLDVEGGDVFIGTGTLTNASGSEDLSVTGNLEVDGAIYGDGSNLTGLGDFMADGSVAMTDKMQLGSNFIGNTATADRGISFDTNDRPIFRSNNGANHFINIKNDNGGAGSGSAIYFTHSTVTLSSITSLFATGNNSSLLFSTGKSASRTEKMRIDEDGDVGIGTTSPRSKLDVNGAISAAPAVAEAADTIDFSGSNFAYTAQSCKAFDLHNMKDGATYTLAVQGTSAATCSFTAYSDAGTTALTVMLPPSHGATTATKETLYSFVVIGSKVYTAWVPGY